jgi:hypothetical protein
MQRLASLRFIAVLAVAGPTLFAACGGDDDDSASGASGSGATSGQHTAGGSAGSGHGGSVSNTAGDVSTTAGGASDTAGTSSNGGTTGNAGTASGGKTGGGGAPSCDIKECLRANVCLDHCGGTVVYTGCCACEAPTVDELSCGAGGAGPGGGNAACVGVTCGAGQTCVAHRTIGGAQIPPDAGTCPTGKHVENNTCRNDFGYTCSALVGCAMPAPTCQCAEASKCGYTDGCILPYKAAWLDTDADLICEQHAP